MARKLPSSFKTNRFKKGGGRVGKAKKTTKRKRSR